MKRGGVLAALGTKEKQGVEGQGCPPSEACLPGARPGVNPSVASLHPTPPRAPGTSGYWVEMPRVGWARGI